MIESFTNLPWKNVGKAMIVAYAAVIGWRLTHALVEQFGSAPKKETDKKTPTVTDDPKVVQLTAQLAEAHALLDALTAKEASNVTLANEVTNEVTAEARAVAAIPKAMSRNADMEAARAARLARITQENKNAADKEAQAPVGAGAECHEELNQPVAPVG